MKTLFTVSALAIAAGTAAVTGAQAQSRDTIQIAGSSTVLPFASIVAEEFGNSFPEFRTPVVGSGGSGGGLRQFCEGVGTGTIDIANASRPIREAEITSCNDAGVTDIREIMFGYDGIVFANRIEAGEFALTPADIFRAIAAQVPGEDGQPVANTVANWKDLGEGFADQQIIMAIPASNHGTREVFEERVLIPGCEEVFGADVDHEACVVLRQDNVIEIAGDYTETLARLQANPATTGVFGLSFYDQNRDTLQVATINGITPSLETIASGEYPVSRPLYFYVKGEHIGVVPGIEEYVEFFLAESVSGLGGPLEAAGLIPSPREEADEVLANFRNAVAVTN